jgi:hypothetical protein
LELYNHFLQLSLMCAHFLDVTDMQVTLIRALQLLGLIRALTLLTCSYTLHIPIRSSETAGLIEGSSNRVFILGPSHHYYLQGCALSKYTEYQTPVGNLPIDVESKSWISLFLIEDVNGLVSTFKLWKNSRQQENSSRWAFRLTKTNIV